jgi:hypothetical protein
MAEDAAEIGEQRLRGAPARGRRHAAAVDARPPSVERKETVMKAIRENKARAATAREKAIDCGRFGAALHVRHQRGEAQHGDSLVTHLIRALKKVGFQRAMSAMPDIITFRSTPSGTWSCRAPGCCCSLDNLVLTGTIYKRLGAAVALRAHVLQMW